MWQRQAHVVHIVCVQCSSRHGALYHIALQPRVHTLLQRVQRRGHPGCGCLWDPRPASCLDELPGHGQGGGVAHVVRWEVGGPVPGDSDSGERMFTFLLCPGHLCCHLVTLGNGSPSERLLYKDRTPCLSAHSGHYIQKGAAGPSTALPHPR